MDFEYTEDNMDLFYAMVKICRNNNVIPMQYVEDMIKMHKKCSIEQQNSTNLRKLIIEAIEYIPGNKKGFQYAANLYNEFLQLTKNDSTSLQVENCVASTSSCSANMSLELESEADKNTISKSTKIFNEFIKKCYENANFPKSNIEVIDKLYRSLPIEFLDSKDFLMLISEANKAIWPDSSSNLYIYVEHIYNQLQQFETSMKVQDRQILVENSEADIKRYKKLSKLKKALKTARKRIKYLEEKEMDINNEDEFSLNSPYILKDRFEKRIIEIYKKICKITNEPDFLAESELHFKETNNKLVNKSIQKYYNLNKTFPDYFEIYTLLKLLREKKKLNWTESELQNISQDAFLKLGKQLKLRRLNEYFSRLSDSITETDPAENNLELKKKLDESKKKLNSDLNALTEKYNSIQDYAEETEGSDLNNSDCEKSSDDSCSKNNQVLNKKFKSCNIIQTKRKKSLSNKSEENEPPKKSQKTIYMESFNLTPCSVALEPLDNLASDEINVNVEKVLHKKTSNDSEKVNNDTSKIESKNCNQISSINSKKVTDEVVNLVTEDSKYDKNVNSYNSAADESFVGSDENSTLVIDESIQVDDDTDDIISKQSQENEAQKIGIDEQTMDTSIISIDSENYDPIISEPIVIINESDDLKKDVIEINEQDDSDVEITSFETPKVPLQNKTTLESIIKSMNFHKKYNWDPVQRPIIQKPPSQTISIPRLSSQRRPIQKPPNQRPPIQRLPTQWPPNSVPSNGHNQHSYNQDQNTLNSSKHNFVNRWIMHNIDQPHRSNNNRFIRPPFNNRLSSMNHRMQSTFHKSTTERQVTQRFMNSVQQQNSFVNNQSIIQQRVTTMTTTTTVRQIVQQPAESSRRRQLNTSSNQNPRSVSIQSKTNGNPELIELD